MSRRNVLLVLFLSICLVPQRYDTAAGASGAADSVEGPVVSLDEVAISGQTGPANANGTELPDEEVHTIRSIVKEAATSVAREVDKSLIKVRSSCVIMHGYLMR